MFTPYLTSRLSVPSTPPPRQGNFAIRNAVRGRSRPMSQLIDSSVSDTFDKLPPHSIEAEMCLLASMMLDKEMIGEVVQLVDRDGFFQADHQIIFDILVKLYEQNRPIDDDLVISQLLDEIGG